MTVLCHHAPTGFTISRSGRQTRNRNSTIMADACSTSRQLTRHHSQRPTTRRTVLSPFVSSAMNAGHAVPTAPVPVCVCATTAAKAGGRANACHSAEDGRLPSSFCQCQADEDCKAKRSYPSALSVSATLRLSSASSLFPHLILQQTLSQLWYASLHLVTHR